MGRREALWGLGFGAAVALLFAIVIRFIPESVFVETPQRILMYAAQVVAGPVFVWLAWGVGRLSGTDGPRVLTWAVGGALAFDGVALGFWPDLYGQSGPALAWTASTLLWAFAWIVIAGQVMAGRRGRAAAAVDRDRRTSPV